MGWYLGFDTSNYTTSVALYNSETGEVVQQKRLLPVPEGGLGLRQSDAVFHHTKVLPELLEVLYRQGSSILSGVGVSNRPRNVEGSYMPCFLVGELAATSAAKAAGVPLYAFSHQEGHIAAALYSAGKLGLLEGTAPFVAFHLSGGTTECLLCTPEGGGIRAELLMATSDLNAGQVVDRVGVALDLGFPAGSALDKLAADSTQSKYARPTFVKAGPSLSGLENKCKQRIQQGHSPEDVASYLFLSLAAVVDRMTQQVREVHGNLPLIYSGGVMANAIIRDIITEKHGGHFAEPIYSSDNAAGIAILAAGKDGKR